MGISTLQSYRGAQVFEAVGLNKSLVDAYFTGTASRIEGVGLDVLAREALMKHAYAFQPLTESETELVVGGQYQYREGGEYHLLNPLTISKLQHAVRQNNPATFQEYTDLIDDQNRNLCTLRGLLKLKYADKPDSAGRSRAGQGDRQALHHRRHVLRLHQQGSARDAGHRHEPHRRHVEHRRRRRGRRALQARRQRRLCAAAPSSRWPAAASASPPTTWSTPTSCRSRWRRAQSPAKAASCPATRWTRSSRRSRHSIPGVGLISPPPHHDIYSIEDLAQLIYDLKNVNPQARIAVKLVSEVGVGTVAAGVAKAHADVVLISGDNGGTGASPLSSIKHAGLPWELGLAETQQVLLLNDLRSRIRVQTDGKLQTGRDVVIAALLGAEEFGFATTPLIAMGCIMMRKCHLNTCPVGIATQDPVLRARFTGQPEHVINFFFFIAEQVRQHMAKLGFRTVDEMVGRVDMLDAAHRRRRTGRPRASISRRFSTCPTLPSRVARRTMQAQDHGLDQALDHELIDKAAPALESQTPVTGSFAIRNVHRTVGAMLGGEIARRYGSAGLPDDTIHFKFNGSAGQSFGAFRAQRRHARTRRRRQRLSRQGPLRRTHHRLSAQDLQLPAGGKHPGRQRGALRRHQRRSLPQRHRRRALRRAQLRRHRGGRRRGRSRLRVHDQRHGRGARHDRPQLRRRHERRHRLRLRRPGRLRHAPLQQGQRRSGAAGRPTRTSTAVRGLLAAPSRPHRQPARRVDSGTLGRRAAAVHQGLPARIQARAGRCRAPKRSIVSTHNFVASGGGNGRGATWVRSPAFWKFEREQPTRRKVEERLNDWFEIYEPFPEEKQREQGARCMDCGVPFCHTGCPVNNLIPDWNDLVYNGRWENAIRRLHATNNFPEFTGRICPAPCEAACVLGINQPPVSIKLIERTIVERAWDEGWIHPEPPEQNTGKRVAVVGSGPAGLAAAQQLRRAGHSVTVFEKNDRIGGLLRYGIPNFKLEKHVIDRRLEQMRAEGVTS